MSEASPVLSNYDNVLKRAQAACLRGSRDFKGINILPVVKYAADKDVLDLLSNRPVRFVAESRLQQGIDRRAKPAFKNLGVKKFFIGALQSNKTRKIVENFDLICSLDSERIAVRIDEHASELGKQADCLIQVKLTNRQTQAGADLTDAPGLIKKIRSFSNINLRGIMAIAPIADNPQDLRPLFKEVKTLFDAYFSGGDYLSLGMSDDFEVAIEEGSNLPRIGGAIFDVIKPEGLGNDN